MNSNGALAEQTAILEMNKVVTHYTIQSGDGAGLILERDIEFVIVRCMSAYLLATSRNVTSLVNLTQTQEVHDLFSRVIGTFAEKVWDGVSYWKEIKDQQGNVISPRRPKTKSPRYGMNFEDAILAKVRSAVVENYKPTPTQLEHKQGDAKRFLEICKQLFPNVISPHKAANGFRDFLENVHNACGTDGAEFVQKALWLYSLKVGGTGKSYFLKMLKQAFVELGLDAEFENLRSSQWINPAIGWHTVTISEDMPKLDASMAETLNNPELPGARP